MEHFLIRLGIVGAGSIVQSHIDAAVQTGFHPVVICGKENSERAKVLSQSNNGLNYASNLEELLNHDFDALLVAVSTQSSVSVLERCTTKNVPILVEKPVALNLLQLEKLNKDCSHFIRVGYNRRFYSSVETFKAEVYEKPGFVQVQIPEISSSLRSTKDEKRNALLENSVHTLDLMQYIFGSVTLSNLRAFSVFENVNTVFTQFHTNFGFEGNLNILFNTPENTSIQYWSEGLKLQLKPLEIFSKSNGMEIIPASTLKPIKTYHHKYSNWNPTLADQIVKPGFLNQYVSFKNFVHGYDSDQKLATLQDAYAVMELALQITDNCFPNKA